MNTCYFCGKKTKSNNMIMCGDISCTENHIACEECTAEATRNAMKEMIDNHKNEEVNACLKKLSKHCSDLRNNSEDDDVCEGCRMEALCCAVGKSMTEIVEQLI